MVREKDADDVKGEVQQTVESTAISSVRKCASSTNCLCGQTSHLTSLCLSVLICKMITISIFITSFMELL